MIELYTSPTPNGYKISVALEELDIPYNVHVVNLQSGDQKKPEFLELNPNGRIPVIVDTDNDNLSIMESGAQLIYLAEKSGNFYDKDQQKPSATLVISGDIFKIYFDENVDLNLIKENLLRRQNKYQEEMDKISQRLSNKGFTDRAPKNIVEQEKTNYSNLKDDIKKISLTIESL